MGAKDHERARRRTLALAAFGAGVLFAGCRGILGIDDSGNDGSDAAADAPAANAAVADGEVPASDAHASDTASDVRDAGSTHADGACGEDLDCPDPIHQTCEAPTCVSRLTWGTLKADLPDASIDYTDQYYSDVTVQSKTDVVIRIQSDKGYVVWSVQIHYFADASPGGGTLPFARYSNPTVVFVSFTDVALGSLRGAWSGTGNLVLTAMSTTSGGDIAGTFSGTLTMDSDTSKTAPFSGAIEAHVP